MRFRPVFMLALPVLALAACADLGSERPAEAPAQDDAARPAPTPERVTPTLTAGRAGGAPLSRPAAARPEAYDRSTAEQKAEASAADRAEARLLGTTTASLGDPAQQGFWIRTPLAKSAGKGRLVDPATKKAVNVDLIPREGPESGGSLVSLAAMQMLGVPLTSLPRLEVFAR